MAVATPGTINNIDRSKTNGFMFFAPLVKTGSSYALVRCAKTAFCSAFLEVFSPVASCGGIIRERGPKCKRKIVAKLRVGAEKSNVDAIRNGRESLHRRGLKLILLDNFGGQMYLSISKLY